MLVCFPLGAGAATTDGARLACSVNTPVVTEGGSIQLRAFTQPSSSAKPAFRWNVDAGRVGQSTTPAGDEVSWDLSGVAAGIAPHRATVTMKGTSDPPVTCSVEILIAEGTRGGRYSGRSFLLPDKREDEGFGLYSYLILTSRPTESERERYLDVLRVYLQQIGVIRDLLRQQLQPKELNITYVPIDATPPVMPHAEWLVEHYDYARADVLIGQLKEHCKGICLISTLVPLTQSVDPTQFGFEDLSFVPTQPPDLIVWWIREFLAQSAQERFWDARTGKRFVLSMRTTISALALGLPDVQRSVNAWITWRQP